MNDSAKLFWQGVEFIDEGEPEGLLAHLRAYPHLVEMTAPVEEPPRPLYFAHPTLVHYLPDNPVRRGKIGPACVDCLDVLVGMGVSQVALNETLGLACSSQSLADSGQDERLITALIQAGASPESGEDAALGHRMERALNTLMGSGLAASLPVRVALDQEIPSNKISQATNDDLQKSLTVAAIWGQARHIPALIQAGASPNLFCPEGFYSHSTPLHQAVMAGSVSAVRALIANGADTEAKDKIWGGTPLDWAKHVQNVQMTEILAPA